MDHDVMPTGPGFRVLPGARLSAFLAHHVRPVTGVAASAAVVLALMAEGHGLVRSAVIGGGWGLCMLYAVQLRGLRRNDGSASWSGVLLAALAFPGVLVPPLVGPDALLTVLDHTALPLAAVYIAAKLGCHRIGCCDFPRRPRGGLSLPMREVLATATIAVLAGCVLLADAPNGLGFLVFLLLHVASWQAAKRYRA